MDILKVLMAAMPTKGKATCTFPMIEEKKNKLKYPREANILICSLIEYPTLSQRL